MLPDARPYRRTLATLLLVFSAALLLLLHLYHPPVLGLWTQNFFNSMHVPVFGVIALSLHLTVSSRTRWSLSKRAIVVLLGVLALSILSEAAQIPGPRDASVEDLVSDWLGAISTLLFIHAFESSNMLSRKLRIGSFCAGVALLLVALSPLLMVSAAYLERDLRQPVLVSFDELFGKQFRRTQNATLDIVGNSAGTGKMGQIALNKGAWPGIVFHDIWPDWSSYSTLIIELGLDGNLPLDIQLRVHDREHELGDQPYSDRFNTTIVMQPGRHSFKISLDDIRGAPKNRQMNLSEIDGIAVFCSAKGEGREFLLTEIRLE